MKHKAKTTHPEVLEELRQLACMVSLQSDLRLVEGEAGSGWSFNALTRTISMDSHRLRSESHDFNRGLVIHECAHAAITRLFPIIHEDPYLSESPVFALINAVEDCRIETWLQVRFPGSRPWIQCYNDILFRAPLRSETKSLPNRHLLPEFIKALLKIWWFGKPSTPLNDQVQRLVDRAWPHMEAICRAFPRGDLPDEKTERLYRRHPLSDAFGSRFPLPVGLECWEMEIRLCQFEMWKHFTEGFLPILHELFPPGRISWIPMSPYPWLERCLDEGHLGPTPSNPTNAGTLPILLNPASRTKGCSPPENAPNEEEELYDWPQDPENYRTAFESQKHLIEQLGDQILRLLHPSKLHRWTGPHRSGSNIDLKSAFRAEADTRSMELVWRRCLQATLSDASITLLVDVSGSMHGQRIESTLIATVLLAEVCHRVGIPLSIFTFSDECRALLRAGEPLDARIQGRLGGITQAAGDGTHLTAALEKVERAILNAGDPNAHVVVLSDGKPTDDIDPKWILRRMGDSGIQVLGLGLGPDSNGLKDHIAHAKTNLEPHQVAEAFVELLNRMAEDAHHPDFRCD